MDNREKLRKAIKTRLIVMSLATLLPIVVLILFNLPVFQDRFVVYSALSVLRYAIFVLLEGYIGFKIYGYIRFFCDPEYADLLALRKNDERLNFIRLKANAMAIKIFIYVCGIALITAGFFDAIVFYTLLSILATVLFIFLFVYIYYSRKY
ncbi:MAG: hypothetical protein K2P14_03075 [Anaeroplasmataceae bacterium]|jgi:hypothetical protein|nr:hypothetical protein [Anaeroplasmataceae bacterium]